MAMLMQEKSSTLPARCWAQAVGSSTVAALVVWGLARLGDVDLSVPAGDGTRAVGWPSVLVAAGVAALAGMALLLILQRRLGRQRARTVWTAVAIVVFLISVGLGPASATTGTGMISLTTMHLVVLLALSGTVWHREPTEGGGRDER